MEHPIKQKAFSLVWENDSSKQEGVINEFYTMRNWQNPAFEALKDAHYMILNAPTGSGKSWMMCLLSAFKMQNNPSLRTIISVPQTIIASGFLEAKIQMPTGEKIHWKIKQNFCEKSSQSTVNNLIKWLERNECNSLKDRTVICTHATLIHLHKKLKNLKKTELLNDVLVWIDEAHHVKNIESENMGVFNNSLGALVSYIVNQENNNIQLGLTTASFFRGDRCSLLTQSMELKFERFNLPYDEYLKTMKYLKSFSVDFLLCGPQYHKAIELLIKERKAKDIIYIPHPVSGCSSGNKTQEVAQIIEGYGSVEQDITDPLIVAGSLQHSYKILNLVDENLRKEKKKFLKNPILKNDRNALDVIIALGMFKEGADWIWADRSIITGARSSLVDMIQMIGRLFRDAQGKEHVEVFQLLPFSLDQQNEDEFSQNLNDYLKAIFASLILENIFSPVKIKILQGPKDKKQQSSENDEHKADWLSQAIPNQVQQQALMEDVMKQLVEIKASNKEKFAETSNLKEEYNKVIPEFIKTKYGIDEYSQEVADQVWNLFARRTAINNGISVENITFDVLQKIDPLDCFIRYTSNVCSIKTFEQFREAIQKNNIKKEERWNRNYTYLLKDIQDNQFSHIPKDHEIIINGERIKIGSWFSDQKKSFHLLSKSKQELLQKLPGVSKRFTRNTNLSIDQWIDLYIKVFEKLQTPLIPRSYIENGYNLGAWIQHIRKPQEWNKLTSKQQKILLDNNFKLSPSNERKEAAVLAMKQFISREQFFIPKSRHNEKIFYKGIEYTINLNNLCRRIKKNPKEIEEPILKELNKIKGFSEEIFKGKPSDKEYLRKGLLSYEKFKNSRNQIIIPAGFHEDQFNLSNWQNKIRSRRFLDEAIKKEILEINPYFFESYQIQYFFQEIVPRIEKYISEYSNAIIPQKYVDESGYLLGEKISDIREEKSNLPIIITKYLNSLGDKWAWNIYEYNYLQEIKEIITHLEHNGYKNNELPKKILLLRSKIKKALIKYPSLESYKKHIEQLAPNFFNYE